MLGEIPCFRKKPVFRQKIMIYVLKRHFKKRLPPHRPTRTREVHVFLFRGFAVIRKFKERPMTEMMDRFEQALLSLDRLSVEEMAERAAGESGALRFLEAVLVPVLERVGRGWEEGRLALSQIYMGGRLCEEVVDGILPPAHPKRKSQPKMAISVLDDYHMLGKRIVYSVLRAGGFELSDYGRMGVDDLVSRAAEEKVRILLVSTLMLPSALRIRSLRDRLDQAGADVRIVVGGAPFLFDENLWKEVGADTMCRNASEGLKAVEQIMGEIS